MLSTITNTARPENVNLRQVKYHGPILGCAAYPMVSEIIPANLQSYVKSHLPPSENDWGAGFKTLCVLEYGELTKAFGLSRVWPRQFCLARSEQRQDHEVVGAMLFAADKHFAAGSIKPIEMFSSRVTRVETTPTAVFGMSLSKSSCQTTSKT